MTTTESTVLMGASGSDERKLLHDWCNLVALKGGSFAITQEYTDNWYMTYTINWPDPNASPFLSGAAEDVDTQKTCGTGEPK